MKRILLCCNAGLATSTIMNLKLTKELNDRGREGQFEIAQCLADQAKELSLSYDIVVSSVPVREEFDCPFIDATGVVLGKSSKEVFDAIEKTLWPE